jgi:hypothetical protein
MSLLAKNRVTAIKLNKIKMELRIEKLTNGRDEA